MELQQIFDQARAYWRSRIILTAVELDIFTNLGRQQRRLETMAADLALSERGLGILLDALTTLGILTKTGDSYANSESAARFLNRRSPEYRGGTLRHQANLWHSWDRLTEVVRTGRPVERKNVSGDDWRSFIEAMHHGKADRMNRIIDRLDLKNVRKVLDLGGGPGTVSWALTEANPELEVILFDLPEALEIAADIIPQTLWGKRIRPMTGDFFHDSIGEGYDLVILSSIIHSYGTNQNEILLNKALLALNNGGRIAVRDFWLDDSGAWPEEAALFSVNMLVNTEQGRSYTESEFSTMLRNTGFSDPKRIPEKGSTGFIVAYKH